MALVFSRPEKLDHSDTIRYEIDMLRFAAIRLAEKKLTERDAWVYLEAFLLHYRNLIEFLGNPTPRTKPPADLHVTNIWRVANLVPPANLDEIHASGKVLWARYEPTDGQGGDRISQYLQHCTMKRIDAKDWDVSAMVADIEPLLRDVEKHLGVRTFILAPVPTVWILDPLSASTTVGTSTAAAAVDIGATLKERPEDFE